MLLLALAWLVTSPYTVGSFNLAVPRTPEHLDVIEGQSAVLECDAAWRALKRYGLAKARRKMKQVKWMKNGGVIAQYTKIADSTEWWSPASYEFDRQNFSLTILSPKPSDNANYRCMATWDGMDTTNFVPSRPIYFRVAALPPTPPRPTVNSFTSRSVTLSWATPDNPSLNTPTIIRYYIRVSAGASPNPNNNKIIEEEGGSTSTVVSSLLPYTTYTFQIQAENVAGRSVYGPPSTPVRTKGEAPVAAPNITRVENVTNGSLWLRWDHPPPMLMHGPLQGYRIMTHHLGTGQRNEYYLPEPNVNSFVIDGLDVWTKYSLSLSADNHFGYSPPDTKIVLTAEGAPGSPPVITGVQPEPGLGDHDRMRAVTITWASPNRPNGHISHYVVYWKRVQQEQQKRVRRQNDENEPGVNIARVADHLGPIVQYSLRRLEPYTEYEIWLRAATKVGLGPGSQRKRVTTDTAPASAPTIVAVHVPDTTVVVLEWLPPTRHHRRINNYLVTIEVDANEAEHIVKHVNTTRTHIEFRVDNCVRYVASVRAVTHSIVRPAFKYTSPASKPTAFLIDVQLAANSAQPPTVTLHSSLCPHVQFGALRQRPDDLDARNRRSLDSLVVRCDPTLVRAHPDNADRHAQDLKPSLYAAIAITMGTFLVVGCTLVVLFAVFRRYLERRKVTRRAASYGGYVAAPAAYDESEYPPITVHRFESHVRALHQDADTQFAAEYELIEAFSRSLEDEQIATCVHATMPHNRTKNRYVNILPYDHSRVILKPSSTPGSDYINANFVDGHEHPSAYIATQGPLPHTFVDFWRMVWEQRVAVIVMITNVVERGRKKCDQYWPSDGADTYGGHFQVRLLNESISAYFVLRVLSLRNLKGIPRPTERVVFHYHYTHWPDHGVPSSPLPVLNFIRKSSDASRDANAGPVVVHCSAGVGRSGTYIVIDTMLQQIRTRNTINVFAFLKHIRRQRNYLVQTEEQYVFCHDALLAAVQSGVTEVPTNNLLFYIDHMLAEVDHVSKCTLLQHQYNLVTAEVPGATLEQVAQQPRNRDKNRDENLIPLDEGRVPLNAQDPGSSDYINASFFQGYTRQDEYIVTQTPTTETIATFWQMIWDYNVQLIVLLHETAANSPQPNGTSFWPDELAAPGDYDYGTFHVHFVNSCRLDCWCCVQLLLTSKTEDYQLITRLLLAPNWPSVCQPRDTVWDLMRHLQIRCVRTLRSARAISPSLSSSVVASTRDLQSTLDATPPVVVVDASGGSSAATFCALGTFAEQLERDSVLDVFTVARLYHARRPHVWPTILHYQCLYDAVRLLLRDDSTTSLTNDRSSSCSLTGRGCVVKGVSISLSSGTGQALVPATQSAPVALDTVVTLNQTTTECTPRTMARVMRPIPRDVTV